MSEQDVTGFDDFEDEMLDEMSTEYVPIPPGTYEAQIAKVEPATFDGKDGEKKYVLRVLVELTDPDLPEELREGGNPKLNYTVWIDRDLQGRIANGVNKNLSLARFRAATNTNRPLSFSQIVSESLHQPVEVDVVNEVSKKNPEMMLNNVSGLRARQD